MNLYLKWKYRKDPICSLMEDYETLIRLARRCSYDFAHALDYLPRDHYICTELHMAERPNIWIKIFAKGNPGKDYRLKYLGELDRTQNELECSQEDARMLLALCLKNNIHIDPIICDRVNDADGIPF